MANSTADLEELVEKIRSIATCDRQTPLIEPIQGQIAAAISLAQYLFTACKQNNKRWIEPNVYVGKRDYFEITLTHYDPIVFEWENKLYRKTLKIAMFPGGTKVYEAISLSCDHMPVGITGLITDMTHSFRLYCYYTHQMKEGERW